MNNEQSMMILKSALLEFSAKINAAQSNPLQEIQSIEIDLSVARARNDSLKVSFPFKSMIVEQATDINTFIQVIPETNDQGVSDVRLSLKDVYGSDLGFRACHIFWNAQPGKKVVLKFFTTSNFRSGSLVIDQTNTPATVSCGFGTAELDGFTREVVLHYKHDNGGMQYCRDTQNNDYNNGTFNSKTAEFFKCPTGFTGKILAAELEVTTPPDFIAIGMDLYAIESGTVYSSRNPGNTNRIMAVLDSDDFEIPVGDYNLIPQIQHPEASLDTTSKGALRRGCIINEGEVLVWEEPFSGGTVGDMKLRMLIRLTPIVGEGA